ncbi:hypothetical protein VDGE_09793 [Verticillium dahliae]|uniref:FMN-dependent dehydrogenase domain-containing protein n=1 Tax=Verticillium dahliae TaxID=27337 RepID=A0A444RIX7_VERDA|nr:hypothetical protein VDGE_09793 [Verticillium dahliae]
MFLGNPTKGECPCSTPVSIPPPVLPVLDSRQQPALEPDKLEQLAKGKPTQNGWLYASTNAPSPKSPCAWPALRSADHKLVSHRGRDVRIPAVPRFFQFYTPHDDELTVSLLRCAHESGSTTSMQRTDTWQLGWRHVDVATSNRDLNRGSGADLGLSDPFFRARLRGKGIDPAEQPEKATAMWMDSIWHGRAWSWDKAVRARETRREISGGMVLPHQRNPAG